MSSELGKVIVVEIRVQLQVVCKVKKTQSKNRTSKIESQSSFGWNFRQKVVGCAALKSRKAFLMFYLLNCELSKIRFPTYSNVFVSPWSMGNSNHLLGYHFLFTLIFRFQLKFKGDLFSLFFFLLFYKIIQSYRKHTVQQPLGV